MIVNMADVFDCYLMVFITLKLIVSKIFDQFFNFAVVCSFLSNCYKALLWSISIPFLVKCKLFCLVSVLADIILTLLKRFFKKWATFFL